MKVSMPHSIFPIRIVRFFAIALIAATFSLGTVRLVAQAAEGNAAQGAEPAKAESKPTQEEQERGFLVNGPIVKWAAKTTGWSRDTTATVFLYLNFAIIFFGIAIPLGRALPKIMRKRSETLSHNLTEARKATDDANARLSAVEAKLAGLDEEIARFRAQVEEDSKADEIRIKASIEEEKTRIVAGAGQELDMATAQAQRNLRLFATELAVEQASKQLTLTPEADRALISEFIGQAQGGKN